MKLKNVFLLLVAVALVFSIAGSTSAADPTSVAEPTIKQITNQDRVNETMAVIFSHATQTYTVTIPAKIDLATYNVPVLSEINATNVVLDSGKKLVVMADSKHNWNLTKYDDSNNPVNPPVQFKYKFEYNLNNRDTMMREATQTGAFEILSVITGEGRGTTPIQVTRIEIPPTIGTYNDYIEFSASIVEAQVI